jgi:hypothetical protein
MIAKWMKCQKMTYKKSLIKIKLTTMKELMSLIFLNKAAKRKIPTKVMMIRTQTWKNITKSLAFKMKLMRLNRRKRKRMRNTKSNQRERKLKRRLTMS